MTKKYTLHPQKLEEFVDNVQFQFDNLEGFLSVQSYQAALVKAKCLVNDLEALIAKRESASEQVDFSLVRDSSH